MVSPLALRAVIAADSVQPLPCVEVVSMRSARNARVVPSDQRRSIGSHGRCPPFTRTCFGPIDAITREVVRGVHKLEGRLLLVLDIERLIASSGASGPKKD